MRRVGIPVEAMLLLLLIVLLLYTLVTRELGVPGGPPASISKALGL